MTTVTRVGDGAAANDEERRRGGGRTRARSVRVTAPGQGTYEAGMLALLEIDPARAAVLTIDMQRDYLDLDIATAPVLASEAERVLTGTRRLLARARRSAIPVIHAYVTRRPAEIDAGFEYGGLQYIVTGAKAGLSQNAQAGPRPGPDRLEGSPHSEVHPDLLDPADIHVASKKTLDSFQHTDLDVVLDRLLHVETVIVAGINTDTCVHSTTFTLANLGYRPVVVRDATASMRGIDRHEMALTLMGRSIAWVVDLDDLEATLGRPAPTSEPR